jgi:hypothetical protein
MKVSAVRAVACCAVLSLLPTDTCGVWDWRQLKQMAPSIRVTTTLDLNGARSSKTDCNNVEK